jgi:hypothetical protein
VFGYRSVEEPKHSVVLKEDDFEIRKYSKMVIAKTFVSGDYDDSTSDAFKKIADYIFGANITKEEIAMTAPVVQEKRDGQKIAMTAPVVQDQTDKGWSMYFIMPSKYSLESLPKPKNEEVLLEELPEQEVAVYSYTGFTNEKKLKKYSERLKEWLKEKGYTSTSEARSARYNHPLTIPFLRTNEVHISVVKE